MVNLTINNQKVQVEEGTTILEAAKSVGIEIPTLCYLKEINLSEPSTSTTQTRHAPISLISFK